MNLATIDSPQGHPRPAVLFDATDTGADADADSGWALLEDLAPPAHPLASKLSRLVDVLPHLDQLRELVAAARNSPALKLNHKPRFHPPVPQPHAFRDFYAFEQHVKTCREKRGAKVAPEWYEVPVFYFSNPGSLIGKNASVYAPRGCVELDFELELGVIIGKGGKDIAPERAWDHVAGFTIINDFSARDLQRKEMAVGLGPAKGKDFATGVGSLVTLDEFKDVIDADGRVNLWMRALVNRKELSRGNAKSMHYTWPQLIAQASRDAELYTGDLIGSGTVGTGCILELGPENTGGWLKPGDVVELEIERLGVLPNTVVPREQR